MRKGRPARKQDIDGKESLARGGDLNGLRDIGRWMKGTSHGQRLVKSSRNGKGALLDWAALGE